MKSLHDKQIEMLWERRRHCGSFEYCLIDAWFKADPVNQCILENAFEHTQFRLTYKETPSDFASKKVHRLERHQYAPEMNTLHFEDGTSFNTPGCVTIDSALAYVQSQTS